MLEPMTFALAALGITAGLHGMAKQISLHPESLAKQPRRSQILSTLRERPGMTISELCRDLDTGWGTIQHHLQILKRAGLVRSVVNGRDHQFFVGELEQETANRLAVLRRGRVQELVRAILQRPGVIQRELVEDLEMHRKVMRTYLDMLMAQGMIKEERASRTRRYYPAPDLANLASSAPAPVAGTPQAPAASGAPAGKADSEDDAQ